MKYTCSFIYWFDSELLYFIYKYAFELFFFKFVFISNCLIL